MIKTFKAEVYRLLKSKSFYITLLVLILLMVLTTVAQESGNVGVVMESEGVQEPTSWTGYMIPAIQIKSMGLLQYFFLPMLVTILGTDFTYQTYKNSLTKGVGRSAYYFSKMAVLALVCLFFTVIYILVPTLLGTLLYGFHGEITWGYMADILKTSVPQFITMFMILAIGSMVLCMSKKSVACTVGYLVIPMVLQVIYSVMFNINRDFCKAVFEFELISKLNQFATGIFSDGELTKYMLLGMGYIVAAVLAGNYVLKKSDL